MTNGKFPIFEKEKVEEVVSFIQIFSNESKNRYKGNKKFGEESKINSVTKMLIFRHFPCLLHIK